MDMWLVISADELLAALRRVQHGEDPDLVMVEVFANTEPDDD